MTSDKSSSQGPYREPSESIRPDRPTALAMVLRVLAAAALGVDAIVHARLAAGYQSASPGGFGEGNLFLAEAAVAAAAGLYVLIRGSRLAWLLALLTAAGGLAVLLLYRYVDIPAFGPFPAMYEPIWYFEKTLTALSQALVILLAVIALILHRPTRSLPG